MDFFIELSGANVHGISTKLPEANHPRYCSIGLYEGGRPNTAETQAHKAISQDCDTQSASGTA